MALTVRQFKHMLRARARQAARVDHSQFGPRKVSGVLALSRALGVNKDALSRAMRDDDTPPSESVVTACGYRRVDTVARYEEVR